MVAKPGPNEQWTVVGTLTQEEADAWEAINIEEAQCRKAGESLMETLVTTATANATKLFQTKRAWWKGFCEGKGINIRESNLRLVPQDDGTMSVVQVDAVEASKPQAVANS